ncbi:hypothetical protein ACNPQJ_20760, partial [Acinetobacter bereziniae]
ALYRRSLEYGLGITAVSKVFYSVANFIYLAINGILIGFITSIFILIWDKIVEFIDRISRK